MNDTQLYTFKLQYNSDGDIQDIGGIIAAESYGDAASKIEEMYGPELLYIKHLCCCDCSLIWFPATKSVSSEDLVDLIEVEVM